MATTVRQLISYLQEIEDKDQPVMYQYYLAEHFNAPREVFASVADEYDSELPVSDYEYGAIKTAILDSLGDEDPEDWDEEFESEKASNENA